MGIKSLNVPEIDFASQRRGTTVGQNTMMLFLIGEDYNYAVFLWGGAMRQNQGGEGGAIASMGIACLIPRRVANRSFNDMTNY